MGFTLTRPAQEASERTNVEPILALVIDGIDLVFATDNLEKRLEYGDNVDYGDANLFYGGNAPLENSRAYITKEGTTSNLTQQIQPDSPQNSSVTTMTISMIDKNQELSELFSFDNGEILYRKAEIYSGFKGTAFPADYIRAFSGFITELSFPQGKCSVIVSHPEDKKRRELFIPWTSILTAAIDDTQTTIPVETTQGLIESQDAVNLYIRINDEIMKVNSFTSNSLNVIRAQFGTFADEYDDETELSSIYRLQGTPIVLSLKLMLSGTGYFGNESVLRINQLETGTFIQNALMFDLEDARKKYNLQIGDEVVITDAINPSNNVTTIITGSGKLITGSYIRVQANLTTELASTAVVNFKSKYDVLPEGVGLEPDQVDIDQFTYISELIGTSLPDLDFLLEEEMKVKEFIDSELFYPFGLYSIPRNGASSVAVTLPPLSDLTTKKIDVNSVTNATSLRISRGTNNNFYNAVVYKFNHDLLNDKFLSGLIIKDEDSANRIKTGNKPLVIESKGMRRTSDISTYLNRQGSRFLDRYKFASESISVDVNYKTGLTIDVADTVIFGEGLQVTDIKQGNRNFQSRIMQVINKSFNFFSGKISLQLLDTAFELDGRYGVISPSSFVNSGSTTTKIRLKPSFTNELEIETTKWQQLVGLDILVHSEDYSFSETVTLKQIDLIDETALVVEPALSVAPGESFIVDLADYDDSNPNAQRLAKDIHVFFTKEVEVTSGASETVFNVADSSFFFIGSIVEVHNRDFTRKSIETRVIEIDGNQLTVDKNLGIIPESGDFVNFIGFTDEGLPYRLI